MTYSQGGLIQAVDFNGFASTGSPNLNSFWAIGGGNEGYGQPPVSNVSQNSLVYAVNWANLINAINSSALHQGTSIPSISIPIVNADITYESSLVSSLTSVYINRLNASSVGSDITNTETRTADWGTNASIPTVTSTITVTFASENATRYFFNAGGTIRISCSRSGGAGSPADLAWSSLCSDIGTLGLPASSSTQTIAGSNYTGLTKFGGSGNTDIYIRSGFYNLNSTPTNLFRQYISGAYVYTSDNIYLEFSTTGSVITISVTFVDDSSNVTNITGNLSVTGTVRPPSTVHLTNTWGTPVVTVTAPA